MSLFPKKQKSTRTVTLKAAPTFRQRLGDTFRDESVILRLATCIVALALMLIAVDAWKSPFMYRLGDHPPHGIVSKTTFRRVNQFETQRLKAEKEKEVAFIFQHDPSLLARLPTEFEDSLREVSRAQSPNELSISNRSAFGLSKDDRQAPGAQEPQAKDIQLVWDKLKASVTNPQGVSDEAIANLISSFEKFIAPLTKAGIADFNELSNNQIKPTDPVKVAGLKNPANAWTGIAREIQLVEQLRDNGSLGQTWLSYPDLLELRPQLVSWLLSREPSTLKYDAAATMTARREARENVGDVLDVFEAGTILVAPGRIIDENILELLNLEYRETEDQIPLYQRYLRVALVTLMFLVLGVMNGYHLYHNQSHLFHSTLRLTLYLSAMLITIGAARWLSFDPWRAEVVPYLVLVMVLTIVYDQVFAMVAAFTLALILTLSTRMDLGELVVLMSVAGSAVLSLSRISSRSSIIKIGFWTGVVYFAVSSGIGAVESQTLAEIFSDRTLLWQSSRGAALCLAAGYLVAGSLPFIESAFGVVTDISLLEISTVSHPLLQELVRRAPGTYNHSMTVASIGEMAADRIGANGLLVRVAAYFHDIGKMLKPHYFIENMATGAGSRHEHLAPAMSTLIIIGHVKDGANLARQYDLPERLIDFIEQHHGTTLVEYFYHEANKQADQQPDRFGPVEESSFRYPGPKPQSREAGVLMLADAVESASRTLSDPAPRRIENLVHDITMKRLLDGQFEECSLTLSEIHMIEESLTKTLIGIYHGRIKYPEQKTA
ncbi:MAG: HDIG domain-containing protein [Planctomycetota bacterium]|nr:HDIG domain-containing protein [Planctomycetota bacterium]MDA1213883.1 HDIG domain-containing protein [Planctomycetota bacterium]